MNWVSAILRRFARTYLVAMGGGFALVTVIGLLLNAKMMLTTFDKTDGPYLPTSALFLLISSAAVVAGFAIQKLRRWAMPLAAAISLFVVGYSGPTLISDLVQPETLTILLPMVLILFWAALPATWLQFKRQSSDTP
jgi:hypothetical protein